MICVLCNRLALLPGWVRVYKPRSGEEHWFCRSACFRAFKMGSTRTEENKRTQVGRLTSHTQLPGGREGEVLRK